METTIFYSWQSGLPNKAQQHIQKIESRVNRLRTTEEPTITIIAQPVDLNEPIFSLEELRQLAPCFDGISHFHFSNPRGVAHGLCFNVSDEYNEVSRYGIVYSSSALGALAPQAFIYKIGAALEAASRLYAATSDSRDIHVSVSIDKTLDMGLVWNTGSEVRNLPANKTCLDPYVLSETVFSGDLRDPQQRLKCISELVQEIAWAFNEDAPTRFIQDILERNSLLG